jgi:molecular chaperone DnaK
LNDTERALNEYADKLDKTEADSIKEKITSLREFVAKNLSGEGSATAAEIKEKVDDLQVASLNLFDKMHKARAETGEQSTSQNQEGEKKDEPKP